MINYHNYDHHQGDNYLNKSDSLAQEGAFLAEPCNVVYSLFYVTKYFSILWTTQNHLLDLRQHWANWDINSGNSSILVIPC